jgi:hypothetical protein
MHRTPTELCKKALQELLENLVEEGVVTLYPGSYGLGFDRLKVHSLSQLNTRVHKMVTENVDSVWEQREDFGDHKTTTTWDPVGILKRSCEPCGSRDPDIPNTSSLNVIFYNEWLREVQN